MSMIDSTALPLLSGLMAIPADGAALGGDDSQEARRLAEVERTSAAWIAAFNRGDAEACAAAYSEQAILDARPVADLVGRDAIREFWRQVLDGDPGTLRYEDPRIHLLDPRTAVLSSRWSMSRLGSGVITLERWQRGENGVWLLEEDRFEIRQQNDAG